MKKTLIFYVITALLIYSCSKEDLSVDDPKEAILGKWRLTHSGNGNDMYPVEKNGDYEEYLLDSILQVYNSDEKQLYVGRYWFEDSLVVKSFTYIDVIDKDTIELSEPYKVEFSDNNSLRLNFQYPALIKSFIYKRIK